MIDAWVWAVLLLALGLALAGMELFIPSGGILAFLSATAFVAAVAVPFVQGEPVVGLVVLIVVIVGLPIGVVCAVRWWPHTPIGRRVLLRVRRSEDVLPDSPRRRRLKALVGQVGRAKSKMLPSGVITVGGRTIDAFSEGMPIEPGQKVVVLEVRGSQVLVRPVDEETPTEAEEKEEPPLSQPIDSVAPDPFRDPPG